MLDPKFTQEALEKFSGCDSDELQAGTPESPAIWLFGIEHGGGESVEPDKDDPEGHYPISVQKRYRYNVRAFKLLAAMHGHQVTDWEQYATSKQPFVKGSPGYFKGNLYPVPCHRTDDWTPDAAKETGTTDKHEYLEWCRRARLPLINRWVEQYQPELFIGVGITCREEFSEAVFGVNLRLQEHRFTVNNHTKRIFHATAGWKKLLVVPHFSGRHGLNSDEAIRHSGIFAKQLRLGLELPT